MTADDVITKLLAEAKRQGLTPAELAKRGDIPYSAAHKLLHGGARRPTFHTIAALSNVVGMPIMLPCQPRKSLV